MEVTNLVIKENKYYEADIDGKHIAFSYDGTKIRGLWFDGKIITPIDTLRESMKIHNTVAKILNIPAVFQPEEINPDIRKVSFEFISDLHRSIIDIKDQLIDVQYKVNQIL